MEPTEILQHLRDTGAGLELLSTPGCEFVYYDPERAIPHDRRLPFLTIVTSDEREGASDRASDLARRGLWRLNLGVRRETYRAMLGPEPAWGPGGGIVETGDDFTAVDTWLPHPIYAPMGWVCIVAPSDASRARVLELVAEAYELARSSHEKRGPAGAP